MAVLNPYNYKKPAGHIAINQQKKTFNEQKSSQSSQQDLYLEQRVMTAKPEELTLMLYDGLVKFIKMSKIYVDQNKIEKINETALRAQAIVVELQSTLNMDYEISEQLDALYDFVYAKLVEGNLEKTDQPFSEALEIALELRETWKEAMALV